MKLSGINPDLKGKGDQFTKFTDLPQSRMINAFMHPEDPEVVITFNRVVAPKAKNEVTTMIWADQYRMYEMKDDLKEHYFPLINKNLGLEDDEDEDTLGLDMSMSMEYYEGGNPDKEVKTAEGAPALTTQNPDQNVQSTEEKLNVKKSTAEKEKEKKLKSVLKSRQKMKKTEKDMINEIIVDQPPKIKGQYSKKVKQSTRDYDDGYGDEYSSQEEKVDTPEDKMKKKQLEHKINLALDMYLYHGKFSISKDDFEDIEQDFKERGEELGENNSLYNTVDLSDYSFGTQQEKYEEDEMDKRRGGVRFQDYFTLPKKLRSYTPQLFRDKYEICYWKLNTHNVVKMKSYYFTPKKENRKKWELPEFNEKQVHSYSANLSIDKKSIVVVTMEKATSTKAHVCIFPIKNLNDDTLTIDSSIEEKMEYEEQEARFRTPIELDVDIVDKDAKDPFKIEGEEDQHKNVHKGFEFANYGSKPSEEMGGAIVTCWNEGRYVLSKVMKSAALSNGFAFKVYDTEADPEDQCVSYFMRKDSTDLSSFIIDVKQVSTERLLFLCYDFGNDAVNFLEMDIIDVFSSNEDGPLDDVNLNSEVIISIDEVVEKNIAITDDLEKIFVNCFTGAVDQIHCIPYESRDNVKYTKKTMADSGGEDFKYFNCIGSRLIAIGKTKDGSNELKIYENRKVVGTIKDFKYMDAKHFSIKGEKILYLTDILEDKVVLKDSQYEKENEGQLGESVVNYKRHSYTIKEVWDVLFKFPYVLVIKGGNEVIHMDMVTNKIVYLQIPNSLAVLAKHDTSDFSLIGLLDFGEMFIKMYLEFGEKQDDIKFGINEKSIIFKSGLPKTKLIAMLQDELVQVKSNQEEWSSILHFEDHIVTYGNLNVLNSTKRYIKRKAGEVMVLPDYGILMYKKNTRNLQLLQTPIDFKREEKTVNVYSSANFLK